MKKQTETKNPEKKFAVVRLIASALIALILTAVTGFAFVPLLGGAAEVTDAAELAEGSYVSYDTRFIMDICAVESTEDGEPVAYYAITPIGNKFTVLRIRAASYDDLMTIYTETAQYLSGQLSAMTVHYPVKGTVRENTEVYQLLTDWFMQNNEWMTESGVIGEVSSYGDYLSTLFIDVDTVGSMALLPSVILTIAAGLFLLYAAAEGVLLLDGYYDSKKAKKAKKNAAAAQLAAAQLAAVQTPVTQAPAVTEAPAAEAAPAAAEVPVAVEAPAAVDAPTKIPAPEAPAEEAPAAEETAPVPLPEAETAEENV